MHIVTSKGCAWRAFYVYSGRRGDFSPPLRFSLGIDPAFRFSQAQLFGSIGYRKDCQGGRKAEWQWTITLPKWKHWWRLDGRLGKRS